MLELFFLGKSDIYLYTILEDVFVVLMLYSFLKIVLLSSLVELIWPTQFFNRKNSSGIINFRLRTFTETILKLKKTGLLFSQIFITLKIN